MHGAHADDLAQGRREVGLRAAPDKLPYRRPCAEELAGEIDVEDALPLLEAHLGKGGAILDAGVVDEYMNRAEALHRFGEHGLHLRLLADIGRNGAGLAVCGLDHVGHFDAGFRIGRQMIDDDMRPGSAQRQRACPPQARACARHKRHLPGEAEFRECFRSSGVVMMQALAVSPASSWGPRAGPFNMFGHHQADCAVGLRWWPKSLHAKPELYP